MYISIYLYICIYLSTYIYIFIYIYSTYIYIRHDPLDARSLSLSGMSLGDVVAIDMTRTLSL